MSFDHLASGGPFLGGPGGSIEGPLITALRGFAPMLKPWAVSDLARLWQFDLHGLGLAEMIAEIDRRIHDPSWSSYRRDHPDPNDKLREVLERYATELTSDAPARLCGLWSALTALGTTAEIEEKVAERLGSPSFRAYLRPGVHPPSTGLEALRAALARHESRLRPGATRDLEFQWTPLVAALPPSRVAGLVARLLDEPRNAGLLLASPSEIEVNGPERVEEIAP
jgi:hypothetical protein